MKFQNELENLVTEFTNDLHRIFQKQLGEQIQNALLSITTPREEEDKPTDPEPPRENLEEENLEEEILAFIKANKGAKTPAIKKALDIPVWNSRAYDRAIRSLQKDHKIWGQGKSSQRRYAAVVDLSQGWQQTIVKHLRNNPGKTQNYLIKTLGYKASADTFQRHFIETLLRNGQIRREKKSGHEIFFAR